MKPEIDAIVWYGGNVQHRLSADEGFVTSLELESKLPQDLATDNPGNYTGIVAFYREGKTGTEKKVTAGDQSRPRRLRHLYVSKKNAQRAANRELQRLNN